MEWNPKDYIGKDVWARDCHQDGKYHKGYISNLYYDPVERDEYFVVNFEDPVCGFFPVEDLNDKLLLQNPDLSEGDEFDCV